MRHLLLALPVIVLLAACAAPDDYVLNGGSDRVHVKVVGADGDTIPAFDGQLVGVPGFLFAHGEIIMHPGKHRLSRKCPVPPGQPEVLDVVTSVEYDFAPGGRYILYCDRGYPAIRPASAAS